MNQLKNKNENKTFAKLNSGSIGAIVLGGHAQGLGIMRSLGRKNIKVFLIDETAANIARFSKYCTRFFCFPKMKQEKHLLKFLIELLDLEKIQGWIVFPTHDATVEILSKNKNRLECIMLPFNAILKALKI